jgi:hypothetical protein
MKNASFNRVGRSNVCQLLFQKLKNMNVSEKDYWVGIQNAAKHFEAAQNIGLRAKNPLQ